MLSENRITYVKLLEFIYTFRFQVSLEKSGVLDFLGGPVVKNPPANAGDLGSIPGPGRSHMLQGSKPICHNYWACALEPVICNKRSQCNEKPAQCNGESPLQRCNPVKNKCRIFLTWKKRKIRSPGNNGPCFPVWQMARVEFRHPDAWGWISSLPQSTPVPALLFPSRPPFTHFHSLPGSWGHLCLRCLL